MNKLVLILVVCLNFWIYKSHGQVAVQTRVGFPGYTDGNGDAIMRTTDEVTIWDIIASGTDVPLTSV